MEDIFADIQSQPRLYIADITVHLSYPIRKGAKKIEKRKIVRTDSPIALYKGKFPTAISRKKYLRRLHEQEIGRKNYDMTTFDSVIIENVRFSSKLSYVFDYDKN